MIYTDINCHSSVWILLADTDVCLLKERVIGSVCLQLDDNFCCFMVRVYPNSQIPSQTVCHLILDGGYIGPDRNGTSRRKIRWVSVGKCVKALAGNNTGAALTMFVVPENH